MTADWRSDPSWRLVEVNFDYFGQNKLPPRPTEHAELANPPTWASLYDGRRIVATWWRPSSAHDATMVAEDERA